MTPSNAFALPSADLPPRAVSRYARALALFQQGLERYDEVRQQHPPGDLSFGRYDRARTFLAGARESLHAGGALTFMRLLAGASKCLRGAVEASFGAFHVYHDPTAWTRWLRRPLAGECSGPQEEEVHLARRAVGCEFSVKNVAREVRSWSLPLASTGLALYEELIDLGAHYNYPASRLIESPEETEVFGAVKRLNRTAAISLRMMDLLYGGVWNDRRLAEQLRTFTGSL
jgi:hypothetical protein